MTMQRLVVLLSLLSQLGLSSGQGLGLPPSRRRQGSPPLNSLLPVTLDPTPCPQLPVVENFQADKYLGRWYEIARFLAPFQSGSCVTADYSLLPNCTIGVINSQIWPDGSLNTIDGSATSAGDPTKASLTVTFPGEAPPAEGNYNVISTDYSSYAVVHSCRLVNIGGRDNKFELSWILARRPLVGHVFLQRLSAWLRNQGLRTDKYRLTRHAGCRYT